MASFSHTGQNERGGGIVERVDVRANVTLFYRQISPSRTNGRYEISEQTHLELSPIFRLFIARMQLHLIYPRQEMKHKD